MKILGTEIIDPEDDVLAEYGSAMMRGFILYLVILSGLLVLTTTAIANPNQDQYIRLAGLVSVLSFIYGHDHKLFENIINKISKIVAEKDSSTTRSDSDNPRRHRRLAHHHGLGPRRRGLRGPR